MMTVVLLTENRHNDVIDQAYTVGVLALCLALIVLLFLAAGRISVRGARRIGRTWIVPATIRIEPGGRGPALGSSK